MFCYIFIDTYVLTLTHSLIAHASKLHENCEYLMGVKSVYIKSISMDRIDWISWSRLVETINYGCCSDMCMSSGVVKPTNYSE